MEGDSAFLSLVAAAKQAGASDLLLAAGAPPTVYVHTCMKAMSEEPLSAAQLFDMITAFLTEKQRERLELRRDLDFSFGHHEVGRFRVNIHYQRRSLAVAVRLINSDIPDLDQLNLPARIADLADLPRGLVLITGPTGSGKSTTLAALIERMNRWRRAHVITLEDPIEFAFVNKNSIIEQREIGDDSPSFAEALRHVVRQKPDVILVGEMRDPETISATLTAAETGHLVLATLHTATASRTVERIVDAFDSRGREHIRAQLSGSLRAIVCQTLFSNEKDVGMVPAVELMMMTPAVARAIRDNNTHLIDGMIETGGQEGMQTLDASIATLVRRGFVSREVALARAVHTERLERLLARSDSEPDADPVLLGAQTPAGQRGASGRSGPRRPWE
ncbi:MAG: type IV pilus twitching motility protein PilT [Phycisphaerae bacterium]